MALTEPVTCPGSTKLSPPATRTALPVLSIHCYDHILSLATKDTLSSFPLLGNTLGIMQQLYVFLEASPKRHAMFLKQGDVVRTLQSFFFTRLTGHESSRKGIEAEFPTTIKRANFQ